MTKLFANKSKRFKRYSIVLLLALGLVGYSTYNYLKPVKPSYMTVEAQKRDIVQNVFATGTITGQTQVDVGAQVSGQILKLYVQTGDEVKKGDLLCEIDPKTQETALKSAKAQIKTIEAKIESKQAELKKLNLEYKRQQGLAKANATSKQSLEEALANYTIANAALKELKVEKELAQLNLDDAETNLGYTKILAPMDGTVFAMVVTEGQTVNANQTTPTILRLSTLDHMKVLTEISEADVVKVQPGMECSFTILGLPYREFKGTLDRIDPAPDDYKSTSSSSSTSTATSSTAIYYNSEILTDNFDRTLRIDMTADVTIKVANQKDVLSLPLTALRNLTDTKATVYVLNNDDLIEKKDIKVGLKDDQYIEVISGISEQDRIVIGDDVETAEAQALANDSKRRRGPM